MFNLYAKIKTAKFWICDYSCDLWPTYMSHIAKQTIYASMTKRLFSPSRSSWRSYISSSTATRPAQIGALRHAQSLKTRSFILWSTIRKWEGPNPMRITSSLKLRACVYIYASPTWNVILHKANAGEQRLFLRLQITCCSSNSVWQHSPINSNDCLFNIAARTLHLVNTLFSVTLI